MAFADHLLLADSGAVYIGELIQDRFVAYEPSRGFNSYADLHAPCRLRDFEPTIHP